ARQHDMAEVAAEDHGIALHEVAHHGPQVEPRPGIDHGVAARHQVVEVLHGGVAAYKGLGLVEVGRRTAVELADLDGLFLVQRPKRAAVDALEYRLELPPLRPAAVDEGRKVHTLLPMATRR